MNTCEFLSLITPLLLSSSLVCKTRSLVLDSKLSQESCFVCYLSDCNEHHHRGRYSCFTYGTIFFVFNGVKKVRGKGWDRAREQVKELGLLNSFWRSEWWRIRGWAFGFGKGGGGAGKTVFLGHHADVQTEQSYSTLLQTHYFRLL